MAQFAPGVVGPKVRNGKTLLPMFRLREIGAAVGPLQPTSEKKAAASEGTDEFGEPIGFVGPKSNCEERGR